MLLVIGTKAAVVRTAVMCVGIEVMRHLAGLEIMPAAFIVFNICCDQHLLPPMLWTIFEHEYFFVLKDYFGIDTSKAM